MRKTSLPILAAASIAFTTLLTLFTLVALSACFSEDPVGTPATELKFNTIADSLRGSGYDRIEISVTRSDGSDSVSIYKGALAADGTALLVSLPEGLSASYRIVVTATKASDAGLLFTKTYTVTDGLIAAKNIVVVPGTGNPDPVKAPAPTGVTLQPEALALADQGKDSSRVMARVLPYPAATQRVLWSSSNPEVASVDSLGWVRSGTVGKATISAAAAADVSKSASLEVTVSKPVKADRLVLQDTLRIYTGMPGTAITTQLFPFGTPLLLNWHSSDESKAVVSSDGKVTGLSAGPVLVFAEYKGDAAVADTCAVRVVHDPPVLSVGDAVSVEVGATVEFPVKVSQEFGGVVQFRWSLDGDTLWDSTSVSIPAPLVRKYPVAGDFLARFSVQDQEGNVGTAQRLVRVGSNAPLVTIESPKDGSYVNANPVTVSYSVNGTSFNRKVALPREGLDTITIDTTINGVKGFSSIKVTLDTKAPAVAISSPLKGAFTNKNVIAVAWTVDGQAQTTRLLDTLKVEGQNSILRDTIDPAGNRGSDTVKITLDTKKPDVIISSPAPGTVTNQDRIAVSWSVDGKPQQDKLFDSLPADGEYEILREFADEAGNKGSDTVKVTRNKKAAQVKILSPLPGTYTNKTSIAVVWTVDSVNQTTKVTETLAVEGENTILREGTNALGNAGSSSVKVIRDTKPPVIAIKSPLNNATVTANPIAVAWTVDSISQSDKTSETLSAGDGEKTITRSFTDLAGNPGTVTIKVILDKDKPLAPVMNAAGTTHSPTNAASGVTWKWTSGGNGNGAYRYWLDNPVMPAAPTVVAAPTATITAALADGPHSLYVQESDAQGNWSPTASFAIVVDKTGPGIVLDQAAQTVVAPAFTVSAAVTDPNAVASVEIAGAAGGNGAMALAAGKYSRAVTLGAGANTLIVTAKDSLGNSKTASVVLTYEKPTITITYPPDGFVTSNGAITVKWDYKVGATVTPKSKAVTLGDGRTVIPINEANADEKSVAVTVLSSVIFVRGSAPAGGDGTSWDKAYREIHLALADSRATNGAKVWVSKDRYGSTNESGFFTPAAGVSLYGGFPATGRPVTEAGRDFTANETILAVSVSFGGIMALAGSSTVDGFAFEQTSFGAETVIANGPLNTLRNCVFRGTGQVGETVYANGDMNIDKCTFSQVSLTGSIVRPFNSVMKLTNSVLQGNLCSSIATVDGTLTVSGTIIKGNVAFSAGLPKPEIIVQNGGLIDGKGNTTDLLSLPTSP
jgi:Big-like domain-containing protein/glucodextranase-like protein